MNLGVTVNSIDRTENIAWPSLVKEDILNNQVDTLSFETRYYGTGSWKPAVGDEIEVVDGAEKVFAGVVVRVEETIEGRLLKYNVECKDWTQYLDKTLVIERYKEMTVAEIIADINTYYLTGFTVTNVNCDIEIKSIAFNRLPVSRCLQILAEQVNYYWYVDYDKDIHFFAKLSENAPFNLTDDNGKYIFNSLVVIDDLSQIRNRIFIEGGEIEGNTRSNTHTGDGTKTNFETGYKFAEKPAVTVGGVTKNVGIEYLNQDADYDCMWSYTEKYIRFISAPAASAAIVITGIPLYPVISQIQDDESIGAFGEYEHSIKDTNIGSEEEAMQYGASELEVYANKLVEATFETYESGLRSGQTINIQSAIRGIDQDFVIQRATLRMRTPSDGFWQIELATVKSVKGIIEFLQSLLSQKRDIKIDDDLVLKKYYMDKQNIAVAEDISQIAPEEDEQTAYAAESIEKDPMGAGVSPDWVLAPYVPTAHSDVKREGKLDVSLILY